MCATLLCASGSDMHIDKNQECQAGAGGTSCIPEIPDSHTEDVSGAQVRANASSDLQIHRNETVREISPLHLSLVLAMLGIVVLWVLATIKFAWDGSLPARFALWGLLPEAYAAISVRSVAALLRLKSGTTPVIVLRNCVTDEGALDLAEAINKYGITADLQSLELPHNPQLTAKGLKALFAAAMKEGSLLEEFDLSYNPQLGDCVVDELEPLLQPKRCKVQTLRLADCGLTEKGIKKLAAALETSKLRVLDLSCNSFEGAGQALGSVLEAPVLEELMLACCDLQPADVSAVAEQLPYTSIKSLQLGGNRFGSEGLRELLKHLPQSKIDELGLEGNDIEAECLSDLGAAWAKRPFSRVRLSGNKMTQSEISGFIRTLKTIYA